VICKDSSQTHSPSMKDSLVAKAAQTCVAMDDLNLFSDDDIPEDWEKGEDGRHRRLPIDDQKRDMIDLETVGQVVNSCPALIGMSDNSDLMSSINQLGGELVDMAFYSSWLGKEVVAHHRDSVRHLANLFTLDVLTSLILNCRCLSILAMACLDAWRGACHDIRR
jgi:hypothetical protein